MADVLAQLAEVEDLLARFDPSGLTDAELHDHVLALRRHADRVAAVRAEAVAVWDTRKVWASDGSKAGWARLGRECSLSPKSAQREMRRARKLDCMPAVAREVKTGGLSLDQAELLGRANTAEFASLYQRDEKMLISHIRPMRHRDAARMIEYWRQAAADATGQMPECCRPPRRSATAFRLPDGWIDLRGSLDPIGGTEFLTELDRLEQQLFETDCAESTECGPDGRPILARTPAQRRADALVQMARRSAAMPAGARLPRPLVTILCGVPKFAQMCELADGTVINPGSIVPLLTDAVIERIVFGSPSRVLDVGVRERFFTGALRRAIEVRDRHCQHPAGCDVPAERCHIDHIIPWSEGGLTTQDNGRCYCRVHNRQRTKRPPPQPDG